MLSSLGLALTLLVAGPTHPSAARPDPAPPARPALALAQLVRATAVVDTPPAGGGQERRGEPEQRREGEERPRRGQDNPPPAARPPAAQPRQPDSRPKSLGEPQLRRRKP